MIPAYPLQWPSGWPLTKEPQRARFGLSMDRSQRHLVAEIERLGGTSLVISTNLPVRRDGLPYAGARVPREAPGGAGVAAYFYWNGRQVVFACDRYTEVGDNIRAIGLTIEAMRGIERWGATGVLERAFTGFAALPPAPVQAIYEEL